MIPGQAPANVALPLIADIGEGIAECLLMTHSGHWDITLLRLCISAPGSFEGRPISRVCLSAG